jgi:hypothetical protein
MSTRGFKQPVGNGATTECRRTVSRSSLAQQLQQLGDIRRDPPRLVFGEQALSLSLPMRLSGWQHVVSDARSENI